ncbi:MAG: hypothetical protein QW279_03335 [Candidatus Jordarchaeaceae archaeon]
MPVVTVNSESLYLYDYYTYYNPFSDINLWDSRWKKDRMEITPGKKCMLHIYQKEGDASSDSVYVLYPPVFTSPGGGFILKSGNPLPISWSGSTGINRYHLSLSIYYSYYDTAHHYQTFDLDTSMYLPGTTTSFTLPATTIFPGYVDTVLYGYGTIDLEAETGCREGRNKDGNIKGNGYGYFWVYTHANCEFDIGTRSLTALSRSKPKPSEIAKKILTRLKGEVEM